jgi:signal transduction histidine kinase
MSDETTSGPDLREQIASVIGSTMILRTSPAEVADAVLDRVLQPELDRRDEEIKRLTYERRLLYVARMVLDRVSVAATFEQARDEAGDVAQRIVDEIGHSVTDEPALGPSFRTEIEQLQAAIAQVRRLCDLTIAASVRVDAIDQAQDTLAVLARCDLPAVREFVAGFDPRQEPT